MIRYALYLLFAWSGASVLAQATTENHCDGCLPAFNPMPSETYIVNAWVMMENAAPGTIDYGAPDSEGPHPLRIDVRSLSSTVIGSAIPVGYVIDDWQLIEGTFTMPDAEAPIRLGLVSEQGPAYFDDVRVFPADGSMKCYVYDPLDLRFVAELDERHFATFYEYDGEGKLIRVKKETERGRMTIQQTQNNTYHAQ